MKNILLVCLALLANPAWSAGIDPDDDEALRDSMTFSVKNKQVYYGRQPLPKLDAATFKVIDGRYISDKNGLYYCHVPTVLMDDSVMQQYRQEGKPGNYFPTQDTLWFAFECELRRLANSSEIQGRGIKQTAPITSGAKDQSGQEQPAIITTHNDTSPTH